MKIKYIEGNLFDQEDCYFAHCISRDCALGAGIAVEFNKRYNMREKLLKKPYLNESKCICIDNVFNLITKERSWEKPTYTNLYTSLEIMFYQIAIRRVKGDASTIRKKLAIPLIGCGLDGLNWNNVEMLIEAAFYINQNNDTLPSIADLEIVVCYLPKDKKMIEQLQNRK